MTTVRPLRRSPLRRGLAAGGAMLLALLGATWSSEASAAEPPKHWLHAGAMPPGAIGNQRLLRGGPLFGYTQPVELTAPSGVTISATGQGGYATPHSERLLVGLEVAQLYRFRAEGMPGFPGVAVYPTVELIDRLYPPPGKANEFPLPVELTDEDLRLAAEGAFVTRVIYVEDPRTALPIDSRDGRPWHEARAGDDPLVLAGELGRPIAILRIGARDTAALAHGCYAEPTPLAIEAPAKPGVIQATAVSE